MTVRENHVGMAMAALHQACRFIEATGYTGMDGRGSSWRHGIDLQVRIIHASTARSFADLAVAEAAHARPRNLIGPTELQIEASRVADTCLRIVQQLAHDIARGALNLDSTPRNHHTVRGRPKP